MRHSTSCPIELCLDLNRFIELPPQIPQIAFNAPGVPHKESRHEAEDQIVDFAVFRDPYNRPLTFRRDLEGPRAAEREPLIGDVHHTPRRRTVLHQLKRELLAVRI